MLEVGSSIVIFGLAHALSLRGTKQMRLTITILTLVLVTSFLSCDRIKKKGQDVADATKEKTAEARQKISDKKDELIDSAFPAYDSDKRDTEHNKKRFKEHLQVDLTDDVKNIYAFGDFLGADYKVLITFTCDTSTLKKIILAKSMTISKTDNDEGLAFLDEFPWWNKKLIAKIKPYKVGKEYEYWQYLWFDNKTKTAYYEEFSL